MTENIKIITNPDKIKIPLESTRNKILALLRVNDMSVSQIAEALDKELNTVNNHINKLKETGFVEVVGKRKKQNATEKVYGRTAYAFLLHPEAESKRDIISFIMGWDLGCDKATLERLDSLGYSNDSNQILLNDLLDIFYEMNQYVVKKVEGLEKEDINMDYTDLLRLKLLIYLIEIKNNPNISEVFKDVLSEFDKKNDIMI